MREDSGSALPFAFGRTVERDGDGDAAERELGVGTRTNDVEGEDDMSTLVKEQKYDHAPKIHELRFLREKAIDLIPPRR